MNKRFLLAIFFLLTGFITFAQYTVQSKYFVYLQTEPAQPFYIRINGQKIDANSSGYLILPQLKDGNYRLIVGFQDNKTPEMTFKFNIDSKDKGYLIKNFGADGWSLFDLQTMAVQKPLSAEEAAELAKAEAPQPRPQRRRDPKPEQPQPQPQQQTPPATASVQQQAPAPQPAETADKTADSNVSDFTKVLSKATNDPSLLERPKEEEKPVVKTEASQPEAAPVQETKSGAAQKELTTTPAAAGAVADRSKTVKTGRNAVVKLSQHSSGTGTVVLYEDRSTGGNPEQIEITIPASENSQASEKTSAAPDEQSRSGTAKTTPAGSDKFVVEEKPPIPQEGNASASNKKKKNKTIAAEAVNDQATDKPVVSGNCKSVAGEEDFLKLRRTMASMDNDDKMIEEAQKAFRNKCYTTAQVKYISSMFLSNAGKYHFFEAAKLHIADPENFTSLQSELKDQYYVDKFNALK
ncbi:DUF4476 domain-containing protein [Niabella ginsenosidivorans]|uniref:DUF4476 domain-containing protein n=1 Tax=Niabella ginsenosidivorans TaxID=1176587 RepID=A0A1A9I0M8_9BACT|nr:DUF4476 domain-containing protein [Niabella ginsenosidivorans]ANH80280.1 DUF4476 domain-containing protein [Niabella ginsenosidivorans]